MEKVFTIVLFGILSITVLILIKKYIPSYALVASILLGCVITLFLLEEISEIRAFITSFGEKSGLNSQWLGTIIKITLISFLGQWGVQMCIDAGERSVADKMEMAIKIIVLVICIPYIELIFSFAMELE